MRRWVREANRAIVDGSNVFEDKLPHGPYYGIRPQLLPPHLQAKVKECTCDEETQTFLSDCLYYGWYDMFATVAAHALKKFMSPTDANAWLGRGQMFVFSKSQFQTLLSTARGAPSAEAEGTLLDVGAGDGEVTLKMSPFFDSVITTEVATYMCSRLRSKGFVCVQTASLSTDLFPFVEHTNGFDVISCLNVLDRCDCPITLLTEMKALLKPNGVLVLAVVLPWCPVVEVSTSQRSPAQQLNIPPGCPCKGVPRMSFEKSAGHFVQNALVPVGLEVVAISRLPYLCKGDNYRPYYILDDAIFVCRQAGASGITNSISVQ